MELILAGIDLSAGAGSLERLNALVHPVPDTLRKLARITDEALVLSTCNRVEVYAVVGDDGDGTAVLDDFFCTRRDAGIHDPGFGGYRMRGREAAAHLFMVAAGLKSMVPGDAQITGQLRQALKQAVQAGTAGQIIRLAFEHALRASRNVRAGSNGAHHADSVAAAAVNLISTSAVPIRELNVVVVGAGATGALTARLLAKVGVQHITIANRSLERARDLARSVGAAAIGLKEIGPALLDADAVISCTGAPFHVITANDLRDARAGTRSRPIIVIDLAVPHDVEPSAAETPGVDLYDIYRIGNALRHGASEGAAACDGDAYVAIQEQVLRFEARSRAAQRGALIQRVVAGSAAVREIELERAARALRRQGADVQSLLPVLDAMANAIAKKLLHAPITYIRETESDDSVAEVLRLIGHEPPLLAGDTADSSSSASSLAA